MIKYSVYSSVTVMDWNVAEHIQPMDDDLWSRLIVTAGSSKSLFSTPDLILAYDIYISNGRLFLNYA